MNNKEGLLSAIPQWQEILPADRILMGSQATKQYGQTTFGNHREVDAALKFEHVAQLKQAVKIAYETKVPIYPISTGNNWGYGSAAPVQDNCVIFDLSQLDQIEVCDAKLGIFAISPGVTFEKLYQFLASHQYQFFVPTVGSGPSCSVIGNILERGFGVTPFIDHFQIVTSIKAILPNGELYERPFTSLGCEQIDACYKWGVGPYLDGIFTQGAFGIVYNMTICLKPLTPEIKLIAFDCTERQLPALMDVLQEITADYGSHLSGIKLINSRQSLATLMKYPKKLQGTNQILSDKNLEALCKHFGIAHDWHGVIAIYGDISLTTYILKRIQQKLKPYIMGSQVHSYQRILKINSIMSRFAFLKARKFYHKYQILEKMFDGFKGNPVIPPTLSLAYWMQSTNVYQLADPNPQRDGCGFIWFTPLLPFKGKQSLQLIKTIESVCAKHNMEPLMAINTLSPYCVDLLVPLIFDKDNNNTLKRAQQCYLDLFEACKAQGSVPYRVSIDSMKLVMPDGCGFWNLVNHFKNAIDPHHIMSPGRYCHSQPSLSKKTEAVKTAEYADDI